MEGIKKMPREIETKFKTESNHILKSKLKKIKAKYLSREAERDIYYSNPNFCKKHTVIRLRKSGKKYIFTVKTKKHKKDSRIYKVRNELEIKIDNPEILNKILKKLTLKPVFKKHKIRTMYIWKKALICLDELPYIGSYVEIEASKKNIRKVASLLGLHMREATSQTYLDIFKRYKKHYKRPNLQMIFKRKTKIKRGQLLMLTN